MSKVRVQCTLDGTVWARIDALRLTSRGGRAGRRGSQRARRELDLAAVALKGLAAIEAAKDTAAPAPDDADLEPGAQAKGPQGDVP